MEDYLRARRLKRLRGLILVDLAHSYGLRSIPQIARSNGLLRNDYADLSMIALRLPEEGAIRIPGEPGRWHVYLHWAPQPGPAINSVKLGLL